MTASKRRHETAAVHEGCTRKKAYGLTVPVVYGPNHEVVGLSVVGLRTPLPKMRWVVYDPLHLTDHIIKVAGMTKKPAICAECGLEGWNWRCAECGCESGIRQGSPGYGPAVNARAARMKGAAEGSPSMDTGQPSTSSPASESADQPAAGSTPTPPADSGSDPLSTALSHLSGGEAAVFT